MCAGHAWSPWLGSRSTGGERRASSLPSAHHIKAAGFAGLQTEFILPSLVFLLFGEDRFCPLAQNAQKSLPLSQPVIEHYTSPSESSLTPGQRASKHPARPGANNRPLRRASLNQQLVNWILWHAVKLTDFSEALPLSASQQSPRNWPSGSKPPGPSLPNQRHEAIFNTTACLLLCSTSDTNRDYVLKIHAFVLTLLLHIHARHIEPVSGLVPLSTLLLSEILSPSC